MLIAYFNLNLKRNKNVLLFLFYVVLVLGFSQLAKAQSGRRPKTTSTPMPTPASQSASAESKTEKTEPEPEEIKPTEKISQILIAGEMQESSWSWKSKNYLKNTIDDYLDEIKRHRSLQINAINGEKMTFKEAKERAKKETDTYILWMGFAITNGSSGGAKLDYIEYAILKPQTAKSLTSGRITDADITKMQKVMGIPSSSGSLGLGTAMEFVGRNLIDKLINLGWISN
ncbi:MAG: hypothetical protein K1X72_17325 [Pyrinomonadaceae bacterium]|nr:hypothetical protein [Pyrinomonadaceae bacterium]